MNINASNTMEPCKVAIYDFRNNIAAVSPDLLPGQRGLFVAYNYILDIIMINSTTPGIGTYLAFIKTYLDAAPWERKVIMESMQHDLKDSVALENVLGIRRVLDAALRIRRGLYKSRKCRFSY